MNAVIIGNSAAGLNALESFRKYDQESRVIIVSEEPGPAYSRVLLPYYLRKKVSYDHLFINSFDYYRNLNAETIFGCKVTDLDSDTRTLTFSNGQQMGFDRLLIATGATPVRPPVKNLAGPGVSHLWTLDDIKNIQPYFKPGSRLLVLGSGFVSLQAAWSALEIGLRVTVFELMPRIMPRVLDDRGAAALQMRMLQYGVNLKVNILTEGIKRNEDGSFTVYARGEDPLDVDLIIVGTGVCPNMGFLRDNRIKTDRGILVDERMKTSAAGIYAAGDVAQGPTAFGEPHVIHALWPTAVEQGKIAGANMAGQNISYQGSLNMNVTQMFGTTVASIGRFCPEGSDEKWEYVDDVSGRYAKIVFSSGVPVGGIIVGNTDDVSLLGLLRPLIRNKRQLDQASRLMIKSFESNDHHRI